MSGTAQDVLRWAKSQLGQTDGAKYFKICGSKDKGDWCVAFGLAGYVECDVEIDWPPADQPWKKFVAPDWHDAPADAVVRIQDAGPAYLVSFDWQGDGWGDHVGLFDHFETKNGVEGFYSYEGNTSGGKVDYKWHPLSEAVCALRPKFGEWIQAEDGRWWYRHADGTYTMSDWERIDGEWYYFDAKGWMYVGWLDYEGHWYYLSGWHDGLYGHMVHGGIYADARNGKCYAFDGEGHMKTDGGTFHCDENGALVLDD